jgi:hypothetical protein
MMQSCASAARLLGGRTHSFHRHWSQGRITGHCHLGSSWHCISLESGINARIYVELLRCFIKVVHVAGRRTAPAGTLPMVT